MNEVMPTCGEHLGRCRQTFRRPRPAANRRSADTPVVEGPWPLRPGFTLVELVIVVLIIGILAAIAGPRFVDSTSDTRENSTRRSLSVVRDAIDLYKARTGTFPGDGGTESDFKTDLQDYLQGPFPRAEVGNAGDSVRIQTSGTALTAGGSESWAYDNTTGEFIINHASYARW